MFPSVFNKIKIFFTLQREVTAKVDAVLAKAPLTILPSKTPEFLIPQARAHLMDASNKDECDNALRSAMIKRAAEETTARHYQQNLLNALDANFQQQQQKTATTYKKSTNGIALPIPLQPQKVDNSPKKLAASVDDSILGNQSNLGLVSQTHSVGRLSPLPALQATANADMLFASPIFNYTTSFEDSQQQFNESLNSTEDLLLTAEFRGGLTNINYDFDLSDHSADNSAADDLQEFDPLASGRSSMGFQPASNFAINSSSGIGGAAAAGAANVSLLDDSPTNDNLLPSPLKPLVTDYRGFSSFEIPTISCNTGDFSSLSHSVNNESDQEKSMQH